MGRKSLSLSTINAPWIPPNHASVHDQDFWGFSDPHCDTTLTLQYTGAYFVPNVSTVRLGYLGSVKRPRVSSPMLPKYKVPVCSTTFAIWE